MLLSFTPEQIVLAALIFVWTGFVRSGLGFGGGALGLPLMLFLYEQPVFWLPVIGWHLLFFSGLTLRTRLGNVDWAYLIRSGTFILPAALIGVAGLLTLPNRWLVIFVYSITLFYAFIWVVDRDIRSTNHWLDKALLMLGGYIAGTSLTGAPLMVAVFARNVVAAQLRNTLFVLWFVLVCLKMTTFALVDVDLQWQSALLLLPGAAIGHVLGLKLHDVIVQNNRLFRRLTGGALMIISLFGLWQVI